MFDLSLFNEAGAVLAGVGHLGAKEEYPPDQIKPDHKHGHQTEAPVDDAVGDDPGDVKNTYQVVNVPENAADQTADESRIPVHLRIGFAKPAPKNAGTCAVETVPSPIARFSRPKALRVVLVVCDS